MEKINQKKIEEHFVRCFFDDECDICDEPEGGSYASGYVNDEYGEEVDYYICGKCAMKKIPEIEENRRIEHERLEKYLNEKYPKD